jgi:hypothetical protein
MSVRMSKVPERASTRLHALIASTAMAGTLRAETMPRPTEARGPAPAARPREADVLDLVRKLHARILRILRVLRHRGYLDEDTVLDPDDALLAQISAASVQGRVALGPDAGAPVRRFRSDPTSQPTFLHGELCADWEGFSLHAKVRVQANDHLRLERLCRYVARPPIATERLSLTPDGRVAYGR